MQVHKSEFRSALVCARTVYHTEGLSAFYVSYPTTLTMSVPFTAVQFTVYEQLKSFLNPSGSYDPVTHMISGGLAGAVAGAVTTPLDVAKTILQTRGTSTDPEIRHVRGMFDAFRIIWARDGMKGFARGLTPRVLTFMPSNALCWLSYEFFSTSMFLSSSFSLSLYGVSSEIGTILTTTLIFLLLVYRDGDTRCSIKSSSRTLSIFFPLYHILSR